MLPWPLKECTFLKTKFSLVLTKTLYDVLITKAMLTGLFFLHLNNRLGLNSVCANLHCVAIGHPIYLIQYIAVGILGWQ